MPGPRAEIGAAGEIVRIIIDKSPGPRLSETVFNRANTVAVVYSQLFVISDILSEAGRQAGAMSGRFAFLKGGLEIHWIAGIPVKRIRASVYLIIEFDAKTSAPCLAKPAS